MSDTEAIEKVETERVQPILTLISPPAEIIEGQRITDDIADEYRLYFDESATGGCILYACYARGWVANPSCRWVMAEMTRALMVTQNAMKPFAEAFERVRKCHTATDVQINQAAELQSFMDQNERLPVGTTISDWRRLADTAKQIPLGRR